MENVKSKWEQLSQILPCEQREQLAQKLLARLGEGWGDVILVVERHRLLYIKEILTEQVIQPKKTVDLPKI